MDPESRLEEPRISLHVRNFQYCFRYILHYLVVLCFIYLAIFSTFQSSPYTLLIFPLSSTSILPHSKLLLNLTPLFFDLHLVFHFHSPFLSQDKRNIHPSAYYLAVRGSKVKGSSHSCSDDNNNNTCFSYSRHFLHFYVHIPDTTLLRQYLVRRRLLPAK